MIPLGFWWSLCLLAIGPQQPPVRAADAAAIDAAKHAVVQEIEASLPRMTFETWLRDLAAGHSATWTVNDCRDHPACVEARVTVKSDRELIVQLAVDVQPAGQGRPPTLVSAVLAQPGHARQQVNTLADLPDAVMLRHVALVGGGFDSLTHASAGGGVLFGPARPFLSSHKPFNPDTWMGASRTGVALVGQVGTDGVKIAAGPSTLVLDGPYLTSGIEFLGTIRRTGIFNSNSTPAATYAGAEFGFVVMSVRTTLGVAHRVAGDETARSNVFSWSVGVQIPIGW